MLRRFRLAGLRFRVHDHSRVSSFGGTAACFYDEVHMMPCNMHRLMRQLHRDGAFDDARRDGGVQLRGIEIPLLARVVAEELLVQIAPDLRNDAMSRSKGGRDCGRQENLYVQPIAAQWAMRVRNPCPKLRRSPPP